MFKVKAKLSVQQASLWIVLSTLPIALVFLAVFFSRHASLPSGPIEGMVISSPCSVPANWVAELLELSADEPIAMCQLDLIESKKRLLSTHLIEQVSLKLCRPNLLQVNLRPRLPVVEIADFPGTGMDASGMLFPLEPLYIGCALPRIYLGHHCPDQPWGHQIDPTLVKAMIRFIANPEVSYLDLSQSGAVSLGQRTCVIGLNNGDVLKCFPENAAQQLQFYTTLPLEGFKKPLWIDLRLNKVALVRSKDVQHE